MSSQGQTMMMNTTISTQHKPLQKHHEITHRTMTCQRSISRNSVFSLDLNEPRATAERMEVGLLSKHLSLATEKSSLILCTAVDERTEGGIRFQDLGSEAKKVRYNHQKDGHYYEEFSHLLLHLLIKYLKLLSLTYQQHRLIRHKESPQNK